MKKKYLAYSVLLGSMLLCRVNAEAQQTLKVGSNPTIVTNGAVLDVEASNKGVLLPRVALASITDATTIPSPVNALTVYNTATVGTGPARIFPGYYVWQNGAWTRLMFAVDQNITLTGQNNHISRDAGINNQGYLPAGGRYNIGIGFSALIDPGFNANSNVAIGGFAGAGLTTGSYNVGIGMDGAAGITSGSGNVGVGQESLGEAGSGSGNTALGTFAGRTAGAGSSGNVFLGNHAGYNGNYISPSVPMSNQLYISNVAGEDALIRGDFSSGTLTINKTAGTTASSPAKSSTLNVNGSLSTSITTVTGNYTVTSSDYIVVVNCAPNSNIEITLPNASTCKGRIYRLRAHTTVDNDYSGQATIVTPILINGTTPSPTQVLPVGPNTKDFVSDGTNWIYL